MKPAVKKVKIVPCVSKTCGLLRGFFNLWVKNVTIAPESNPIKIAGKGSGLRVDVAPQAIPPYINFINYCK